MKARDAAVRLAATPPSAPAERVELAKFLTRVGSSAAAVRVFESGGTPDSAEARAVLAQALLKSGRREECRKVLAAMEASGELPARTNLLRGIDAQLDGETSLARAALEEAQRKAPDDPEIWAWRGWAQLERGEVEQAEAHLREGIRRFPDSHEIRSILSGVLYRGRPGSERILEEIVEHCSFVTERHPFDLMARVRKGLALNRLGRHVQAVEVFLELTREYPDKGEYWANLGIAQVGAGRARAATKSLVNALRLLPEDPVLRTSLGNAYISLSKREKRAEEMLRKALGIFDAVLRTDPSYAPAYVGKARAIVELSPGSDDVLKAAILLYEQALERDRDNFEALLNVALLYYDLTVLTMKDGQRNDWYWKTMDRFRRADRVRPAIEWDGGARDAFEDMKRK